MRPVLSLALILLPPLAAQPAPAPSPARPATSPALKELLEEATKALAAGPFHVMQKQRTPPSGDKHDYMSVGPYWWPDPAKPNGLPYIRRDGETNPDRLAADTDAAAMKRMHAAVSHLALAFRETRDERFAAHATRLLRDWFLDPATRMNPNLNFGQSIPGRVDGRGIGIIDTAFLVSLCEELHWLEPSAAFTPTDATGMRRWLADYLHWLLTSKNGLDEAKSQNNHGTWYDAQVAALALHTGRPEIARRILEEAKLKRIAKQIEPDGSQPLELARTKALSYSAMNLRAFFELATLADHVGLDLWRYETKDHRGLRKALDYIAPYADPATPWPGAQIGGVSLDTRLDIGALPRRAARAYKEPRYEQALAALPEKKLASQRWQLLFPK